MLNTPAVDGSFAGPDDGTGARHGAGGDAKLFFNAIPSAILTLLPDAEFTISAANDEYLKQTGTVREQSVGRSFFDLFPGRSEAQGRDSLEDIRSSLSAVIETRSPQQVDTQPYRMCQAGRLETRYWRVKNAPVLGSDGSLLCVVHQIEDLTESFQSHQQVEARLDRMRTLEDELREREQAVAKERAELERERRSFSQLLARSESWRLGEEKFRLISNTLSQHVWTARADGTVDFHTQQFAEFAGVPRDAGLGDLWANFIHPDDVEGTKLAWSRSVSTGEPYERTFRLRHHTGTYRWTLTRAVALKDDDQTIFKWVGCTTDIHEQVLAQQELRDAHRRKDEFLAMLAHELRNPLAPIGAGAEILLRESGDESRVLRVSEMISRQVKHVTGLIDELLEVSRVTTGRVSLDEQTVDMKRVVRDSTEQVRPLMDMRQHRWRLACRRNRFAFGATPIDWCRC
ncbi:PAS domain-containing sensor histidine kinase [Caballeronia telluris]|uniref:histidine kinase n=1 Tax=Caballeronia telluris TaxID=326475 RepID=A0A158KI56_9BURK|nr:PAS domain-containing protein [Caballeronia telluris]SAL80734.1 PAS/PAC sensor hybrid histidine kinase [Caballeronia telluris]